MKLLLVLILFLTGCSNKVNYNKEISDAIIGYYQNEAFSKKLDKKQLDIVNRYIESKEIINLDEYIIKEDDFKTTEMNTYGVYVENNNCYINKKNLEFTSSQDHNYSDYAKLVCNGYFTILNEDLITDDFELMGEYRFLGYYGDNNFVYRNYENGNEIVITVTDEVVITTQNDNSDLKQIPSNIKFDLKIILIIFLVIIGVILYKRKKENEDY